MYLDPVNISLSHFRFFLFPNHKTGFCIDATVGRIVFFHDAMVLQIRPHLFGELHDAVLHHITSQFPAAGHTGKQTYRCRLSTASRTSPMVEIEKQSRIPENFICSSLSILPIFSARQLIS